MAKVQIHSKNGVLTVEAEKGVRLSDLLRQENHAPDMPCGGRGTCGKCRVRAVGDLSPVTKEEKALSKADLTAGIRLSCCTFLAGDAEIYLVTDGAVSQICASGVEQDFEENAMFQKLGVAIDIGTTTLAAQLYDRTGLRATGTAPNPQRSFGADVISRIGRSIDGDREALAATIQEGLSALVRKLCADAGEEPKDIDGMVITGNTAMLHLLTGTDAKPLAGAPFIAKERFGKMVPAGSLHLPCPEDTPVYLPRCISAFVGADITTALLASGILNHEDTALLADIGTNGELALWHGGRLTCCSTAAGPAFEGANLSCGMQGAAGAVDHVWVEDGKLAYHTIGEKKAVGICGSGVADLLASLLRLEDMDETGHLEHGDVHLTDTVYFSQKDVRQVQLAKSSVRSGMETLLHENKISYDVVKSFPVAGGFGSYLSMDSAAAIGLIPPPLKNRCVSIGNAALSGAAMLLRGKQLQDFCTDFADKAISVELATSPFFIDQYVEQMMFELEE